MLQNGALSIFRRFGVAMVMVPTLRRATAAEMSNGSQKAHLNFEIVSYVSILYFMRLSYVILCQCLMPWRSGEVSLKPRRCHVLWLAGISIQSPLEAGNTFTESLRGWECLFRAPWRARKYHHEWCNAKIQTKVNDLHASRQVVEEHPSSGWAATDSAPTSVGLKLSAPRTSLNR